MRRSSFTLSASCASVSCVLRVCDSVSCHARRLRRSLEPFAPTTLHVGRLRRGETRPLVQVENTQQPPPWYLSCAHVVCRARMPPLLSVGVRVARLTADRRRQTAVHLSAAGSAARREPRLARARQRPPLFHTEDTHTHFHTPLTTCPPHLSRPPHSPPPLPLRLASPRSRSVLLAG